MDSQLFEAKLELGKVQAQQAAAGGIARREGSNYQAAISTLVALVKELEGADDDE